MMYVIRLLICAAAVVAPMSSSIANLLVDASFEEGVNEPFSEVWTTFGNAHCESVTPRSGVLVAKLFGNFWNSENFSGVYQDVPATPGKYYEASAHLRHNSKDSLNGSNEGWIKVEYFDADYKLLKTVESLVRIGKKSAANRYVMLTTGRHQAPQGAVHARFVAVFKQGPDNAPGAVLVDDVSLRELP